MKKLFVLILSILFITCLSFSLLGCGGEAPNGGNGNGGGSSDGNHITITYYDEFSSEPKTKDILKESTSNTIFLDKPGYAFLGLFDSKTGGIQIFNTTGSQIVPLSSNTTLYARFQRILYKKSFAISSQYGSVTDKVLTVSDGDTVTTLYEPTITEGFEFVGWKAGENGPIISDGIVVKDEYMRVNESTSSVWFNDTKFYAQVVVKKYNVNFYFDPYDFDVIPINHGSSIAFAPAVFDETNDKKEFVGWSMSLSSYIPYETAPECNQVTQDLNIYAYWREWKEVRLIITTKEDEQEKIEKVYNDQVFVIPEYDIPGYRNTGWFTTPRFDRQPLPENKINYSATYEVYYGRYELADYKITFNLNGGKSEDGQDTIEDMEYQLGEKVYLPDVVKENYTFLGWCEEQDLSDTPKTKINDNEYGDKTLYAKYRGDYKKVIYNLDVGSIAFDYKEVEYGAEYQLDIPMYDGFGFCGWYLDPDFTEQLTDKDGFDLDGKEWEYLQDEIDVYGKFSKKYYITVTHSIEGAGSCEIDDYYTEGDRVRIDVDSQEQYMVKGIMLNGVLVTSKDYYNFTMPDKNMQFVIVYEARQYTITLSNEEGAYLSSTSQVVSYGESYTLPTPIKEGYKFLGWEHDLDYMTEQVTDANGNSLNAFTFTQNVTFVPCFVSDPTNTDVLIATANDFFKIASNTTATYQLIKDIDMSGKIWTPCDFSGKLFGNGFKVKNLSISSNSGDLAVFKTVTGQISGVTFENLSVNSFCYDHVAVAGVCVTLKGTLNSVYATGIVSADDGITGGLVAILDGGTITNCTNVILVTGLASEGDRGTGGIVGIAKSGNIIDCANMGKITGKRYTGGILGRTVGSAYTQIRDVSNSGYISSKGDYTGGIIGCYHHAGDYTLQNFDNSGKIEGVSYVGGVIGAINNTYTSGDSGTRVLNLNVMTNSGQIVATGNVVGGVIGHMIAEAYYNGSYPHPDGTQKVMCREFSNTGNVTGELTVGGIFGYIYSDNGSSELINFMSSAKITATGIIGGLIGESNNVVLQNAINDGTNFVLENTYIVGSDKYAYVGGYIGKAYGTNVIGAVNQVVISYSKTSCTGSFIGGIAGYSTGTFTDCENTGDIDAPNSSYVGGIAGGVYKAYDYTSQRIANSGDIKAISYVGGIFGEVVNAYTSGDSNMRTTNLNELTNTGKITATGDYVGGIIGRVYAEARYNGSYPHPDGTQMIMSRKFANSADVSGVNYVGGLVGSFFSDNASSEFIEPRSKAQITATAFVGGLIGQCENAKISNPENKNSTITSNSAYISGGNYYAYIGGYVGYALGVHIENAVNTVNIIYNGVACKGDYVGGIFGRSTGTFTNVENKARISAPSSSYVGGIAGEQARGYEYTVKTVKNSGNVAGVNYVGGIFGNVENTYTSNDSNERFAYFIDVVNEGSVTATGNYAGGIAGRINAEAYYNGSYPHPNGTQAYSLQNVSNSGSVTGADYVGGIVGYAKTDSANAQVVSYAQTGKVIGQTNFGEVFGYVQNLTLPISEE